MTDPDQSQGEAIQTLCTLIADGVVCLRGDAVPGHVIWQLKAWRVAVETGYVKSVWCEECDAGHLANIVQNPDGSELGWRCPEVGFVPAARHTLRAFKFNVSAIARSLAEDFTAPQSFDSLVNSRGIWRLGQRPIAEGRTEVLLMARLSARAEMDRLTATIRELPPAKLVIVLVAGVSEDTLEASGNWHPIPLRDLLVAQGSDLRIDAEELELQIGHLLLRPSSDPRGRPSRKAQTWQALRWLKSRGELEIGRNARVRQLEERWSEIFGGEAAPPRSTLQKHVTEFEKQVDA